jgi:hypothetical protein
MEGAYFMPDGLQLSENIKILNPRGRLVFVAATLFKLEKRQLIDEDLALFTGLPLTEVQDWLHQFRAEGSL